MKKNEVCAKCGHDEFHYDDKDCCYCGNTEFIDSKKYRGPKKREPLDGGNPRHCRGDRSNTPRNRDEGRYRWG